MKRRRPSMSAAAEQRVPPPPLPSYVGESAAVLAVLSFIYWASAQTPSWAAWGWVVFGAIFIVDWMLGGIADSGICRRCWGE